MVNYRHKLLAERAIKRLDERTPMDARTDDRFTQKPTTQAPDQIRKKAVIAVYAVDHADMDERKALVTKALEPYTYESIVETDGKKIEVRNLVYGEVAEDGFINDDAIVAKFKEVLVNKIRQVDDKIYMRDYYINSYFDKYPRVYDVDGSIRGDLTVSFISRDVDANTNKKEGQLKALSIYNQIVRELRSHVETLRHEVEKFADQWDNAYRRTWAKDESIAYADLPWAEKTQTTVNEGKDSQKLFGNKKRLNEAIDRLFEDAVEIGANLKTEEEMMSK